MAFENLSYGDETRRNGDYVSLPHAQDSGGANAAEEGDAVTLDGDGNIAQATASDTVIGVLYTYQYGDESRSYDQQYILQDREATVKTRGTVKANVAAGVTAGDSLQGGDTAADGTAGAFDPGGDAGIAVALTDAQEQDGKYYAEVLLR